LRQAGLQARIRGSSDVVSLLIVTVTSSGFVASSFVAIFAAAGVVPWSGLAEAGYHFGSAMQSALSCFFLHCFCYTSELINGPDRFMAGPHFNW
jgi:hypothetical protein